VKEKVVGLDGPVLVVPEKTSRHVRSTDFDKGSSGADSWPNKVTPLFAGFPHCGAGAVPSTPPKAPPCELAHEERAGPS